MPQPPLNTVGTITFGKTFSGNALFTLNPNIPAANALERASILQDCANKLIFESALGNSDPTKHLALSALYLGEMAKAIMDDVAQSLGIPA